MTRAGLPAKASKARASRWPNHGPTVPLAKCDLGPPVCDCRVVTLVLHIHVGDSRMAYRDCVEINSKNLVAAMLRRRQRLNFSYKQRPAAVQHACVNSPPIEETPFTFLLSRNLRRTWLGSSAQRSMLCHDSYQASQCAKQCIG